jgi:hypothetical protein
MTEESMRESWGGRRLVLAGVLILVAMLAHAPALFGQEVRGTVRDSASNQPLPNTVILVLDPAGRPAARTTTDAQGRFRVVAWAGRPTAKAARAAANLRLRVLRMGFRPHEVPLAQVAGGTAIDVLLSSFPINLEEVQVVAAPSCPKRPDRPAVLALLQQVRMALYANVLARSQNSATMTQLLYARRFDGDGGRVAGQTVETRVTSGRSEPFNAARSAAAIDRQGFRDDGDGQAAYLAPDAETLIDADFAENHCFRIMAPDRGRPRQMGLGFEPAVREDTGHIDIVGTLWVDTLSRVLRDLTFRYVGLDRQTRALGPEGRMSFRELSNGVVVVDKWSLRLVGERGERGESDAPAPSRASVMAGVRRSNAQEIGGEVARVSWPDGYNWTASLGALRLRAVDAQGRPADASIVQIIGTNYEARRDGDGSFVVSDLLPGPYAATIRDPRLAALDIPLTSSLRFNAVRDSTTDVRVQVETADDFASKRCGADGRGTGKATLLARVVGADGRPVSDARWTVRDEFGSPLVEGGRVDADGLFHWCQAPMSKRVSIEVWREDRRTSMSRLLSEPLVTLRFELPGANR